MTRVPENFQIELTDTLHGDFVLRCVKCTNPISSTNDPEHVIVHAPVPLSPWRLHITCYGDVVEGMVQFFRVFIIERQKKQKVM